MATYCTWFFRWDDVIDSEDASLEYGARYRAEAIDYIRFQLGLARKDCTEPQASTPELAMFADVGKYVREKCDGDFAQALFSEIEHIIACCGQEQESAGKFPSEIEYWNMRYGTSGVYAYCVIAP
jgi:hypothetical protein